MSCNNSAINYIISEKNEKLTVNTHFSYCSLMTYTGMEIKMQQNRQ